ncbi:MAG: sigma-70 family RNA polymerase sigma factor [Phycisphaerae bacterium]|nr:sigma-70 family RNA polymerase sigma factor [Phycisphaerae bacterium]
MNDTVNEDCTDLDAHRAGDREAFTRLVDRHGAVTLAICRQHTANLPDAEDACQEAFIRAHRKLHQVHDCTGFRSWLYAIAKLACSERRRSAGRRARHEGEAMTITRDRDRARSTTPSEDAARAESLAQLDHALNRLPEDERLAIHLYYLEPDPVAAARSALGLGRSAFYKLLAQARERLAGFLEHPAMNRGTP